MPVAMPMAAGMTPAWTADKLIPRAKKLPSSRMNTRRADNIGASMAMKPVKDKHLHGAVTLRHAPKRPDGRQSAPENRIAAVI